MVANQRIVFKTGLTPSEGIPGSSTKSFGRELPHLGHCSDVLDTDLFPGPNMMGILLILRSFDH